MEGLAPRFRPHLDWRISRGGVLNPVKNQGQCNMCWAILAVEAVSAALKLLLGGDFLELSSQELLDCVKESEVDCYTLSLKKAFAWIQNYGVRKEVEYPFVAEKHECRRKTEQENKDAVKITGLVDVDCLDEAELMKAVSKQPVAAGIEMTKDLCILKEEIYRGAVNYKLSAKGKICKHAILITGFGFDEKEQISYWHIKNSWGTGWGVNGYGRIARSCNIPGKPSSLVS